MEVNSQKVLGLFCKQPLPGMVKTRLAVDTTPGWAARVAEAMLRDSVFRLRALSVRKLLVFAPPEATGYFEEIAGSEFSCQPQVRGNLGLRMHTFLVQQFSQGAERIVLIGSDSPTLPMAFLEQAFDLLGKNDVVICPAQDGGYCLLGCARSAPPIFDGIDWGNSGVCRQTLNALERSGRTWAVLPSWHDVDTLEDWHRLKEFLLANRAKNDCFAWPNLEALIFR